MQEKNGKWIGKLPVRELSKILSKITTIHTPSVITGPGPGEDAGIVDLGSCMLVSHVDPITEAGETTGKLAVIVASNDVAVTGARPRWAQVLLLLPPGYPLEKVEILASEIGKTARELGIEVIGGHTEYTPGLEKPIVAVYVMGCTCRECIVPTGNAKPGDVVVQIGYAGQEGAFILANDFEILLRERGVPQETIEYLKRGVRLSVIDIAVELAEKGLVHSMHDATEGGLLGALVEVALASSKTLRIDKGKIVVDERVAEACKALNVDPLKLISSGTLIVTAPPENLDSILEIARRHGYVASPIGTVEEGDAKLVLVDGEEIMELYEPPEDEISRFWK